MKISLSQIRSNVAVLAVPWLLVAGLGLSGCDSKTEVVSQQGTITAQTKASFAGKVVDVNGDAISGANISLLANRKYTATTDASGNYLIEVDLGDVTAASGGGTGNTDDGTISNDGDWVYRDFPIEFSKSGFTSFRQVIEFEGLIGYTDGSGAVVLLSQVGSTLPQTVLVPYVDSFSFTVYAGDAPAANAVVTLVGNSNTYPYTTDYNSSSYFEVGSMIYTADANGQVTISASDKLPASGYYSAFVAPYDAGGDGQYEYDATYASSIFNLSANRTDTGSMIHDNGTGTLVQTENAPSINLRDYSSDITVVYNSLQGNDTIPVAEATDFSITIMLNRPVTSEMLANWQGPLFSLYANDGNMPVPFTMSNTGGYLYTITPDITLDPTRNEYRLYINDNISFSADWGNVDDTQYADNYQPFVIYDPLATFSDAIVPGLDINQNNTYKVDWDRFLVGDMTISNPLSEDTSQGPYWNDDLRLSFMVDPEATGYQVWMKDSNSPWINIEDAGGYLSFTYNDGQAIEVTVNNVFSPSFAGGEFVPPNVTSAFDEPFLDDNTIQVVVMPENVNGFATDPNSDNTIAGLSLNDNWGPEVMNSGNYNFDSTAYTEFDSGTYCDETSVNIAVGEPLLSTTTLTPEFGTGEFGAKAVEGSPCFTVTGVRYPDQDLVDPETDLPYPSNFSYIEVDLAPVVMTTTAADASLGDYIVNVADNAGFAYGDSVMVGDQIETVYGFVSTDRIGRGCTNSYAGDSGGRFADWRSALRRTAA